LKSSAAVAAGAYGLSPSFALAAPVPEKFDGSAFKLKAPEPNAKSGGVLRHGMPLRAPHFDIHQAGTIFVLGAAACMFDNLIRRDPNDGAKTIIPDLAHSWEIAPDGQTYTFHLRQGVQFHDGAELTSEDVKATYDRIARPPTGISIPRSVLFKAVSEINARDKYTVEFKLSEPRPISFMMSAFASGWNVIVRKKTLEDNNYNLRKLVTYPGTGPFRSVRRVENELWVMERNPNYWNNGLPYLDGIEFYHVLPFSPEMGSAILSGRVDYVRITDPVTIAQSPVHARLVDRQLQPERDPRDLSQQQEKTARRPAGAPRDAPRPRPAGLGRSRQGCRPDVAGQLHLPVLRVRHAQGGARQTARLPARSRSLDQGSPNSAVRSGLSKRYQRFGLYGPRHRDLQTVVASDSGDAERGAERPVQPAHGGRIGMVRRRRKRAF
jgi:hypothetical protein